MVHQTEKEQIVMAIISGYGDRKLLCRLETVSGILGF